MDLFFSPLACSMSGRIALAEAGATVNLIEVDPITKRVLASGEDYQPVNPLGYVPALRLDDGTVLTENSAILQHIADEYPEAELAPPASDRIGRAKLSHCLSFARPMRSEAGGASSASGYSSAICCRMAEFSVSTVPSSSLKAGT